MAMGKAVTWTEVWPRGLTTIKAISKDWHFRCCEIEESRKLDIRTRGVPKTEFPFQEKDHSHVGGHGEVEGPVDRMWGF
jgi:hypothetical protein